MNKLYLLWVGVLLLWVSPSTAQKKDALKNNKAVDTALHQEIEGTIKFLEYIMNTLASDKTKWADKETIISQSYSKVFRDADVQIEDDLDEDRKIVTNKDVQAYLKDVDFFFQDAKFSFGIESVNKSITQNGQPYYIVKMLRKLSGVDVDGNNVNNVKDRFAEINYQPESGSYKIASIYTTKISEEADLRYWWSNLSYEWRSIFKEIAGVKDSVSYSTLQQITAIDSLNIAGNRFINDIEPLSRMSNLRYLNISRTLTEDLLPIRSLTKLEVLKANETLISSIEPVLYLTNLQVLEINKTRVKKLTPISNLSKLSVLSASGTHVQHFSPLKKAKALKELNISNTAFKQLDSLKYLPQLELLNISGLPIRNIDAVGALRNLVTLDISGTETVSLHPLDTLPRLKTLNFNNTPISDLNPLYSLPALQQVYADNTLLIEEDIKQFLLVKPKILFVYNSGDLLKWWYSLSAIWRKVFTSHLPAPQEMTKEYLAQLLQIDSLNLSKQLLSDYTPLKRLYSLRYLDVSNSYFKDATVLQNALHLRKFNASATQLENLTPLNANNELRQLHLDDAPVKDITPLYTHKELTILYMDGVEVPEKQIQDFRDLNPKTLVIYKSKTLDLWWTNLSPEWQDIVKSQYGLDGILFREELHKVASQEKFIIKDKSVNSLAPIQVFDNLKTLIIQNSSVSKLEPLMAFNKLETFHCTYSPVSDIRPLGSLQNLEEVVISNTSVEDIDALSNLKELKILDFSSTQVKNLTPLENSQKLEVLNCANTRIRFLKPLYGKSHLLKVTCYNTRVSKGQIKKLKRENPETEVVYY